MWRSLRAITLAIRLASGMSLASAGGYARVVQREAARHSFDPFLLVALVRNESRWNPRVVNSAHCVGLGQVCLSNYLVCRDGFATAACQVKQAQLQNGYNNLGVVAGSIASNRVFCRRKTGHADGRHWLASYGGYNKPAQGIWCGQKKDKHRWKNQPIPVTLKRILSFNQTLVLKFARK